MATRYGHEYGRELVEEYGWSWATPEEPEPNEEDVDYGDRWVVDPLTWHWMTPHQGKKIQDERNAEKAGGT